jgi:hypothetical protein
MALNLRVLYVLYGKCNANQHLVIGFYKHNGIRSAIKRAYLLATGYHVQNIVVLRDHWRDTVLNENNN